MVGKNRRMPIVLLFLILAMVASVPAFAGSAVIGSVAVSSNATVGGQALLPQSTLFSGDSLQVNNGAAVVELGKGNRLVFGRETLASFLRESDGVTVVLDRGFISLYRPEESLAMRFKVGDISIVPAKGFKTLGEIAMANGAVVVTTREGLLRVERNGQAVELTKGKRITVTPQTARAPAGAAVGAVSGVTTGLRVASVAGGLTSAVLMGGAISVAGDARTAADSAGGVAQFAVTAANTATTNANNAKASLNNLGQAINTLANDLCYASPYTPTP